MPFEDAVRHPLLRKALQAGEEQVGRVVGKLLADSRVASGLQALVSGIAHARGVLEKGMAHTLHAVNLPSKDDVAKLRIQLEELESMIDTLAKKVNGERDVDGGAD